MSLTTEQMAAIAERLGWMSLKDTDLPPSESMPHGTKSRYHWVSEQDFGIVGVEDITYSDGELLSFMLDKAADIGRGICLQHHNGKWLCHYYSNETSLWRDSKLEAVALAFIQIPKS